VHRCLHVESGDVTTASEGKPGKMMAEVTRLCSLFLHLNATACPLYLVPELKRARAVCYRLRGLFSACAVPIAYWSLSRTSARQCNCSKSLIIGLPVRFQKRWDPYTADA
jgi:hypothetical protein